MKYPNIVLIIIFFIVPNLSFAQIHSSEAEKNNKEVCIEFTKELVISFKLNENEYIKLKNLNMLYISKLAELSTFVQLTSSGLTNSVYELEEQHEHELLLFLLPVQLQAYNTYKEQNKSVLRQLVEMVSETNRNKEMIATTISDTH